MAIITDGINQHFRDARAGRPMEKTASSGQITVAPGRLPRVGLGNQVHGGNTAYGRYLGERTAAFQRHGEMTGASANVSQSSPAIRNPLLSITNFDLPYDRKTLNQWIRFYAKMDPFVGNIIELHGQFPISDFHFAGISDEGILQQYDEQKERCRMVQHAFESSQEYEKLGEAFTFWQWDDDDVCWNDYTIINPDRLEVQEVNWGSDMNAFYSLDPPDELKALTRDGNPEIQSMLERLDPAVLEALSGNRRVPLDPFNVMALIRKDAPYESRGTSPILRVLRTLMYKDKLIEAQYAIADQQITPVQLWKIGDPASNFMPSEADLEAFRALLQAGRHDPLFTIVSHAAVNLDLIGYTGKLLPIIPEMEWAAKQIMIGLFTNEATITGAGPCFSIDTETLTEEGWKLYDDVRADEKIATFNPETKNLEYHVPTGRVSYKVIDGDMVSFKTEDVDLLVTPNHEMWVNRPVDQRDYGAGRVVGKDGSQKWEKVKAENVRSRDRFLGEVGWIGDSPKSVFVDGTEWNILEYLSVMGLYLSDGGIEWYRHKGEKKWPNAVRINQSHYGKHTKYDETLALLSKVTARSVVEKKRTETTGGRFTISDVGLACNLAIQCGLLAPDRQIPRWVKNLSPELLRHLIGAMHVGDGHAVVDKRRYEYYTCSAQLADDFQEIALKAGYAPKLKVKERPAPRRTMYKVAYTPEHVEGPRRRRGHTPEVRSEHIERITGYTGRVYCFEVPNHLFLVRRNGCVSVQGNTYGSAIVALKILQGRYQAKRDKMVDLYKKKLLKPFAEARGIFKTTKANVSHRVRTRRVPVIPDIEWNFKLDLTDSAQRLQYMMQLRDKLQLPARVLCDVLNLDYETVKKNLKDEEGTVFDPAYQSARSERAKASGGTGTAGGGAGLGAGGGVGGGGAPAAPGGDEAPAADATPPAADAGAA